jgi:hypothetical protein
MDEQTRAPAGCRQSLTTAITVLVGFSLTFLRTFWLQAEKGGWSAIEVVGEVAVSIGIILQITALFRALDVNADIDRYRKTVRLFQAGVGIVVVALVIEILGRGASA